MQNFAVGNVPGLDAGWGYYRKLQSTTAIRIDGPFGVETLEGPIWCQDGWLALDVKGNPYPIAANVFEGTYEPVEA